ncbi:YL1 nuclear protein-domain-containing protein [Mycena galopus ATCC 62051]|nr:YL1 nuclear protein-domain-containing protein [Mycena galopus ATCC 62051]
MDVDAPDELLATRRSRRSTAGNRMEAAMAEMELDESLKDAEEDADYTNDKDEEDIFDADFESTDDEAQETEVAAAENAAQEDEKRARKATRTRLEKATDAAHARNKATFNPQATAAAPSKPRRRVALGGAVNAATGETITERPTAHRQSMRKHTVLNTSLTETRLKRSEEKKASQAPKKARAQVPTISQAELIARALDAEEGNIIQHRDYLKLEEEKRRRARVVRPTIHGPLVRWLSRVEEATVVVPPPPPPTYNYGNYGYAAGATGGYIFPAYQPQPVAGPSHTPSHANIPPQPLASSSSSPAIGNYTSSPAIGTYASAPIGTYRPNPAVPYIPYTPPPPVTRTEKVARNYVVHEETQDQVSAVTGRTNRTPNPENLKPTWGATMTALFGAHVNWEDVKVYTGKNRPMSRPIQTCPLTGRAARYRDPRTGVPFADVGAYETLTRILNHEFVWSPELGAYVRQEPPGLKSVAMEE